MARKRYHYDAKGRLRGYSTDKYQPGLKDMFLIMVLVIVGAFLFPGLYRTNTNNVVGNEFEASEQTPPRVRGQRDEVRPTLEEQGYPSNMTDLERCVLEDQQACRRLDQKAR